MSDHFEEVDPANGTEPVLESGAAAAPPSDSGNGESPEAAARFTAPEKLTSVVQTVLNGGHWNADPKLAALMGALTSGLGRRLILGPMLDLLPPMDEPAEWDAWLELLAGCALELTSDGYEIDLAAARQQAQFVFSTLFEGA